MRILAAALTVVGADRLVPALVAIAAGLAVASVWHSIHTREERLSRTIGRQGTRVAPGSPGGLPSGPTDARRHGGPLLSGPARRTAAPAGSEARALRRSTGGAAPGPPLPSVAHTASRAPCPPPPP